MNIQYKTGSDDVTAEDLDRLTKKLEKLSTRAHDGELESLASVSITRESGMHTSESLWKVAVQLTRAGHPDIYATETAPTIETAIDRSVAELKDELRRHEGKQHSLLKRGGRLLKRLRQGW